MLGVGNQERSGSNGSKPSLVLPPSPGTRNAGQESEIAEPPGLPVQVTVSIALVEPGEAKDEVSAAPQILFC